jgi:lipopolysaccharide/colanic/teichoic acid biosynthesis glycosyltransferase
MIVAVLVRWRVGSPVIYAQSRVGIGGRYFKMYKFRTMIPDRRTDSMNFEGPDRRLVHKSPDDPRVLPFGRLLRRLSLDELPQLWNVLIGDMSLVGPRPELPEIVADYEDWQHARHAVKPGITCLWQIWSRDELLKESTDLDLRYVDSISFLGDMKILLATPAAAILQKNGY